MTPSPELNTINAMGFIFLLIIGILTFILPKRWAFLPLVITCCYMTLGQNLMISSFHFTAMRLVILFSWIRLIIRGELFALKLNSLDKAIIGWVVSAFVIFNLLWRTSDALAYRLGFVYNTIGIYFFFRFCIRDFSDIERIMRSISIVIIPLAVLMLYEHFTGRNCFSIFGGVQEYSMIREGRIRCQGPFRTPILSGTFGATLLPMLMALWFEKKNSKLLTAAGIISATMIMVTSSSSGPLMAYIFGVTGLLMWFFRNYMRAIRWAILLALVSLHMIMKAPVWYLIARLSDIFGGSGWHRSYLIDQAISRIGDWWLRGIKDTADWMPYTLEINATRADITNQYIAEGISGGLLTMVLFIVIIITCFRIIGLSLKKMDKNPFADKIILWSLGATLFAHAVSFIGVPYFDQIIISWYLLLAMIAATADSLIIKRPVATEKL